MKIIQNVSIFLILVVFSIIDCSPKYRINPNFGESSKKIWEKQKKGRDTPFDGTTASLVIQKYYDSIGGGSKESSGGGYRGAAFKSN